MDIDRRYMKSTRRALLVLFMFVFLSCAISTGKASPDKETLYVDGFDSTYTQWSKSGTSPYIDNSNDYIYTKQSNGYGGYFTFADTNHSNDTFNSVEIYFECYQTGSGEWFEVWIYDGSSWSYMGDISPDSSYSWKNMNISSKIDSWTKVDACQLYVVYQRTGGPGYIYIRRCYLYVDYTLAYNLNLRVMDWDLLDTLEGAIVHKDSDYKTSDENGWVNWTQVSGSIDIKVKYYGYWVNSTSISMDSDKTIFLQCNLHDVRVTVLPNNQQGIIELVNVTVFNATQKKIRSGITNSSGQTYLTNLPNNTLTFTVFAKTDFSVLIANVTHSVNTDEQTFEIIADLNYGETSMPWLMTIIAGVIVTTQEAVSKKNRPES